MCNAAETTGCEMLRKSHFTVALMCRVKKHVRTVIAQLGISPPPPLSHSLSLSLPSHVYVYVHVVGSVDAAYYGVGVYFALFWSA